MKLPCLAGFSLAQFLEVCEKTRKRTNSDGCELQIYEPAEPIDAPERCFTAKCPARVPLRRQGSYRREVIEGLIRVFLLIYRFRCGVCGRTVSRPYSFLVPYRRFTASQMCQALEKYGEGEQTSYGRISDELSVEHDDVPKVTDPFLSDPGKEGCSPARSTVFGWIDFICKRIGMQLQRVQKEVILRGTPISTLPNTAFIRNANSRKSGDKRYKHQQKKAEELDKLTYLLRIARSLTKTKERSMHLLRAYFFQFAEKCCDLLTDATLLLPIAQTSERQIL